MTRALLLIGLAGCSAKTPAPAAENDPGTSGGDDSAQHSPDTAEDSGPAPIPTPCASKAEGLGSSNCVNQADCRWDGDQAGAQFGSAIASNGDIDGDGIHDLVIGAPLADLFIEGADPTVDAGAVFVHRGFALQTEFIANARLDGRANGAYLGGSVAIVPDLNGDGFDDIVAGARGDSIPEKDAAGSATVWMGRRDGWDAPGGLAHDARWFGERAYSRMGTMVAGAQDMDGDGLGELLLTSEIKQVNPTTGNETYGPGRVILLAGRTDFLDVSSPADPTATIDGVDTSDAAGLALATADLDGDGYPELIISAPYANYNRGSVAVFHGGSTGITGPLSMADAPVTLSGGSSGDAFGWAIGAGDLDGDGMAELAVGAPLADGSFDKSGVVTVYAGEAGFLDASPSPIHTLSGEFDDHQFGTGIWLGGDVDGDGHGDLLVGAVNAWRGVITKGGRVYGFTGAPSTWGESSNARTAPIQIHGGNAADFLGEAIQTMDLDRDGIDEVVIASGYTNLDHGLDAGSVYLFWGG